MRNPQICVSGKRPITTKRGTKAIVTSLLTALETDAVLGCFRFFFESITTGILEPYSRKMSDTITKLAYKVGALKHEYLAKYKNKTATLQRLVTEMEMKMNDREQQGWRDSIRKCFSSLISRFNNDEMVTFFLRRKPAVQFAQQLYKDITTVPDCSSYTNYTISHQYMSYKLNKVRFTTYVI